MNSRSLDHDTLALALAAVAVALNAAMRRSQITF
jgi:hypothetical protein